MKIFYFTIVSFFLFGVAYAQPIFQPQQGGTGIGSATAGEVNNCLKVSDDSPFTYTLGTCGGGTISNDYITKWATSSYDSLLIHPAGAERVAVGTTTLGTMPADFVVGTSTTNAAFLPQVIFGNDKSGQLRVMLTNSQDSGVYPSRGSALIHNTAGLTLQNYENDSIGFWTGQGASSVERMRIQGTGAVAVATTSVGTAFGYPSAFAVQGNAYIAGTSTSHGLIATGTIQSLGRFVVAGGNVTQPAYTFAEESQSGFFRPSADNIAFAINGVQMVTFGDTNFVSAANIVAPLGSAAAPSYTWDAGASQNTGFYLPAQDTIGFTTDGAESVRITSLGSVGIGTTSPGTVGGLGNNSKWQALFAVQGNVLIAGTTTVGALISTSTIHARGTATSTFVGDITAGDMLLLGTRITLNAAGNATSTFGTAGIDIQGGGLRVGQGIETTDITSTSTFAQGINIARGCFALNDVCINATIITGTGKVGQVPFFIGGTTLGGDTPFVYNSTLTRLGVGTSTPGTTLSVNGSAVLGTTTVNGLIATSSIQANVIYSGNLFLGLSSGTTTIYSPDLRVGTTTDAYGRAIRDNVYLAGRTVQGIPVFYEEFIAGQNEPATALNADTVDAYNLNFDAETDCQLGQQSALSPWTKSKTGAIRLFAGQTAPDIGDGCILQGGARTILVDANPVMEVRLQQSSVTNSMWGGFGFDTQTANDRDAKATSTADIIYLAYSEGSDWYATTCASSVCTVSDTNFAPSSSVMQTLRIEATPAGVTFLIDTGTGVWQQMAFHSTTTTTGGMLFAITNELKSTAAGNGFWIDYIKVWLNP